MAQDKDLLILAAMDEEERALLRALSRAGAPGPISVQLDSPLKITLHEAAIQGGKLWIARSGMGPVNAALTLAMIAERRAIESVILLGVGGALSADLRIGDLVVSTRVLQHDSYSSLESGHFRMRPGNLVLSQEDAQLEVPTFDASAKLVKWMEGFQGAHTLRKGLIASGSEFVGTVKRKQEIASLHPDALLVDMEAAGIAQTANLLGIPFVVAKTVADRLLPSGSIEADFRTCLEAAAENAAAILTELLEIPSQTKDL